MDVCERRWPMTTRTNDRIGVQFQHAPRHIARTRRNARTTETVPRQSGQHRFGLSPAIWPNAKRGFFLPQLSRLPYSLSRAVSCAYLRRWPMPTIPMTTEKIVQSAITGLSVKTRGSIGRLRPPPTRPHRNSLFPCGRGSRVPRGRDPAPSDTISSGRACFT